MKFFAKLENKVELIRKVFEKYMGKIAIGYVETKEGNAIDAESGARALARLNDLCLEQRSEIVVLKLALNILLRSFPEEEQNKFAEVLKQDIETYATEADKASAETIKLARMQVKAPEGQSIIQQK